MTLSRQNNTFRTWKKIQTCNKVYEAISHLTGNESINYLAGRDLNDQRKVYVKEIRAFFQEQTEKENKELEKIANQKYENGEFYNDHEKEKYISKRRKKAPSQKTIERCISEDSRIVEDGSKYFISDDKKFENEFGLLSLDPREFGVAILDAILGSSRRIPMEERSDSYYKEELNDFVVKIGCFIIFAMIEVAKPFRYKTLHPREGEDLVYYWLSNIIPVGDIFTTFRFKFDEPKQSHNWKTPISEMRESIINKMLNMMQELYPDIYKRYIFGKKTSGGKNFTNDE